MTRFAVIVYLVLVVLLVILPFFITESILFFPESHAEAFTILIILGLAYCVHLYDVRLKEKEKKALEDFSLGIRKALTDREIHTLEEVFTKILNMAAPGDGT